VAENRKSQIAPQKTIVMKADAKFHLERRKDQSGNPIIKNVPIRLSLHFDGYRLEYYTGIRVQNANNFNLDYWKTRKQFIASQEPQAGRKNQKLKDIKAKAELIYDQAIALGERPTPSYIKQKLDEHFKGATLTKEKKKLVKEAFEEFLIQIKRKNSVNTWKKHNTTYKHLASVFLNEFDKLTFERINTAFVERFRNGLINQGFKQRDEKQEYLNNTVVKYLDSLRYFLNWCKDEQRNYFNGNAKFEDVKENEINVIYLTAEEIAILEKAKMPNELLAKVKDVFLFGCYTGMRFSDLYKLKRSDVLDDSIRFYITKNHETTWHVVPVIPKAKQILNKYKKNTDEKALPVLSNQETNQALKLVMQEIGLNEMLTIREKKADGVIEERQYKKWELITCHTSRKSFISFAVERGMNESVIKSITGHSKNSRAFTKYYEISEAKKRAAMEQAFTSKKSLLKAV
jgi:integrase